MLHSRRPFISTSVFAGLTPSHIEKGDKMYVFLSGRVPYVPRRMGEESTLLGEAYVHGLMCGEWTLTDPVIETFILR